MAESTNSAKVTATSRPTPQLPRRLTDLRPVALVGTGVWAAALVVLSVIRLASDGVAGVWLWTCLAGVVLGLLGLGIITWQRAAARRGALGAQRGI